MKNIPIKDKKGNIFGYVELPEHTLGLMGKIADELQSPFLLIPSGILFEGKLTITEFSIDLIANHNEAKKPG
jgi:hypothetical protein